MGNRLLIRNGSLLSLGSGGETPSTAGGGVFTGATIPLTYKDNNVVYENEYDYKSASHNITIAGLTGVTITGNGTTSVKVVFDVTSAVSSLENFTITCVKGAETLVYNGMHAHYGVAVTGILTFAYTNITKDGSEGTIGTEYLFIETAADDLPVFTAATTLWNGIYSYQVLNVLIGKTSLTTLSANFLQLCYGFNQPLTLPSTVINTGLRFLQNCYSFNQPLDISGVTDIGNNFLQNCYSFNQPLDISGVTDIGNSFLQSCYSFNQPLDISGVTDIGNSFLQTCFAFNQPLDISGVTTIGNGFLFQCFAFNQPLDISGVTTIGNSFLQNCYSFNQPLTIPSTVTTIGITFLNNCYSISAINYNTAVYPTDNNSLSQNVNSKTSASGSGIMVYGTNRAGLITALPDRTATPFRKLINGGS